MLRLDKRNTVGSYGNMIVVLFCECRSAKQHGLGKSVAAMFGEL